MPFFSRVFRSKDSSSAKKQSKQKTVDSTAPAKPQWTDAYSRIEIAPEEVHGLIKGCTQELKSRGKHHETVQVGLPQVSDGSDSGLL
jgi:hypothetical protein